MNQGVGLSQPAYTNGVATAVQQIIEATANTGLLETPDSLAYRVAEIDRHLHSRERWLGKLAVQTATDWADDTLTPFVAISGNNAYGADANDEAQVVGTDDTPIIAGSVYFDVHRIMVIDATHQTVYKLRLVWGTGTMAAAIAAGQTTETMVQVISAAARRSPVDMRMPRIATDTKVWVQAWNATDNATVSFLVGYHEYEG